MIRRCRVGGSIVVIEARGLFLWLFIGSFLLGRGQIGVSRDVLFRFNMLL